LIPGSRSKIRLVEFEGREVPHQMTVQLNSAALSRIRYGGMDGAVRPAGAR
jgi:hypothetical protein